MGNTSVKVLSYLRNKSLGWIHEFVINLTRCPYNIVQIKAKHRLTDFVHFRSIAHSFFPHRGKADKKSDSPLSGSTTSLQSMVHPSGFEKPNVFKPDLANARQWHEETHTNHNLKHQVQISIIHKRKLQLFDGRLATTKLTPQTLYFFAYCILLQRLRSDHRKSLKVSCNPSHKKNF